MEIHDKEAYTCWINLGAVLYSQTKASFFLFFFLNRKCITPLNSNLAMAHIEFFRMYPIFDKPQV